MLELLCRLFLIVRQYSERRGRREPVMFFSRKITWILFWFGLFRIFQRLWRKSHLVTELAFYLEGAGGTTELVLASIYIVLFFMLVMQYSGRSNVNEKWLFWLMVLEAAVHHIMVSMAEQKSHEISKKRLGRSRVITPKIFSQ